MAILKHKETVEILKDLVNSMALSIFGKDDSFWVDNLDGTYTLEVCNTYWFTVGDKFEDVVTLGRYFTVTEVVKDTSITVSGSAIPSNNEAILPTPRFYHGTILAATNELTNIRNNEAESKPIIYLLERFDETYYNDESSYDRVSNLRMFFLLDGSFGWETTEHYDKVITPMRQLVNYFIDNVIKGNRIFDSENIEQVDSTTMVRFGLYRDGKGNVVQQLNEEYTGIEIRFDLPLLKLNACCGDITSYATCRVANYEVKNLQGALLDSGTIPSGGSKLIEVNAGGVCADGTVNVNKSDTTLIASVVVASGGVEPYNVADSTVTNNAVTPTYTQLIKATENLLLPQTTYNVYVDGVLDQTFSIDTLKNETINISA